MAYDENGNYSEDQQQQPDPNAGWNAASNQINAWKDQNKAGGNIDWGAAQNAWNQSGGDLNKVYSQSSSWLSGGPQQQAQQQSAAPAWGKDQYEAFRNDWLGQGFGSQTSSDKLQQVASKYGIRIDKGQHAFAPDGSYIGDMIGDVGGRNTLQFLRGAEGHATTDKMYGGKTTKPKGGISPPGPGNKPPAGGGGAGGGGGTGGGGMVGGALGAQAQELYNMLMERAKRGENVDPNDPIIKAQTDAYRSEGTAARRNFLADQAEAAGPYGNQRSEERRSAEQLGKSVGGFQAGAMQQELGARRQQIEHALDQAGQFMTDQQRMSLQNELTRLQLAQQESQFGRNLKQQGSQFDRDLGFRYAGLNQNDAQFRDRLGFDYGDRSNYWDAINRGLI